VVGALLDAIFLDVFDNDAVRLQRMNQLIAASADSERYGMRLIDFRIYRPSRDLNEFADAYEAALPRAIRFMTRGLGTRETPSSTLLGLLMFQRDYLKRLVDLGYADAQAHQEEIAAFLGEPPVKP
jgi:NTE family protein